MGLPDTTLGSEQLTTNYEPVSTEAAIAEIAQIMFAFGVQDCKDDVPFSRRQAILAGHSRYLEKKYIDGYRFQNVNHLKIDGGG